MLYYGKEQTCRVLGVLGSVLHSLKKLVVVESPSWFPSDGPFGLLFSPSLPSPLYISRCWIGYKLYLDLTWNSNLMQWLYSSSFISFGYFLSVKSAYWTVSLGFSSAIRIYLVSMDWKILCFYLHIWITCQTNQLFLVGFAAEYNCM